MKKEIKKTTITFGELKKCKIKMPSKWLKDLVRRYGDKPEVQIDMKDLVNKIVG